MQLRRKNSPKLWKDHYRNPKSGKLTTGRVEAVCDADLYCWYVFRGLPGANNDLTVVEDSPLLRYILNGDRSIKLNAGYNLDGQRRRHWFSYFLPEGIYPSWPIFVKPIQFPATLKQKYNHHSRELPKRYWMILHSFAGEVQNSSPRNVWVEWIDSYWCATCLCDNSQHSDCAIQAQQRLHIKKEAGEFVSSEEVISEFINLVGPDSTQMTSTVHFSCHSDFLSEVVGVDSMIRD